MKIKHAIFDMDGTLTQSNEVWREAMFHYIDNFCPCKKEDLPEIFYTDIMVGGTYEAIEFLQSTAGDTNDTEKIMEIIMEKVEKGYSVARQPKKGAAEFLQKLKAQNADICVITATPKHLAEKALELSNLRPYIDFIISGEDRKSGKDKPYIFLEAAARMNCNASDCVLFEDALCNLRTAQKLGMKLVGIDDKCFTRQSETEKMREICDIFTDNYTEIPLD